MLSATASAIAAASLTVAPALGAEAGKAPGAQPPLTYGIVPQGDGEVSEHDLDLMEQGRVDSIRIIFHWDEVEPEEGRFDWRATDSLVRRATRRGIGVLPFLYGSTNWSVKLDGRDCKTYRGNCSVIAPASDQSRAAFAEFAAAAVARYGPGGEFWREPPPCVLPAPPAPVEGGAAEPVCPPPGPPCRCIDPAPIRTWQIWNEQNSAKYYAPEVSAQSYARLLADASAAIRSLDPEAEIMLGGMWGPDSLVTGAGEPAVTPVSHFLRQLYAEPDAAGSFDSVAVHPYAGGPRGVELQLRQALRALRRAGDTTSPISVTEIGWATAGGPGPQVKDLPGQARSLRRSFKLLRRERRAFRLQSVFWYTWRDGGAGSSICSWCANAGLRFADGSAKPAWNSFIRFTGGR